MSTPHGPDAPGQSGEQENPVPEPGLLVPTIIFSRNMGSVSLSAMRTDSSGTNPCDLWDSARE